MNANVNLLSDRVLLNNYLSGDRSAISELIERHSQRVRSYIAMMASPLSFFTSAFTLSRCF